IFLTFLLAGKTRAQYIVNGNEIDTSFNTTVNHVFGNLDKTRVPFGLLRDYAMAFTSLDNYNGAALVDSNFVGKGVLSEIYRTLATARVTAGAYTTLPNPDTPDSLSFAARHPGQVTLEGLFYQYGYLDPNALNNGKITVSNGQFFDKFTNGVWQNPYLQGNVVGFTPANNTYQGKSFNMIMPTNLWLTNSSSMVSSIQVDAGDGLGYRTLAPGANLAVSYADTGLKVLNFKVNLTNSTVLQSHSQLHVIADPLAGVGISVDWSPGMTHGFSAASQPGLYNVTSTATYNGIAGQGLVSVQLSRGHNSLTTPLIVAEGFDPGIYTDPENAAGVYSISDFNTSIGGSLSSTLINLLEGSGDHSIPATYDIIFIDFKNGTDDIRRNALVVEDVIRWVNDNKTGSNQNVVLGLSMGGLCARYALKKMENAGETHQTRLFISDGTPEQGAVVPLGLQYADNHLHTLYVRSGIGVGLYDLIRFLASPFWSLPSLAGPAGLTSLVNTPAAKQMLVFHSSGFT